MDTKDSVKITLKARQQALMTLADRYPTEYRQLCREYKAELTEEYNERGSTAPSNRSD